MTFSWVAEVLVTLAAAQSVLAHSWVETIHHVSSNGSFVGNPGYAMGYIARTNPAFADASVQNKITDLSTYSSLCRNFGGNGYADSTIQPITASPGDTLAMQWFENGHVTDPTLTPRGYRAGNVMIYGIPGDFSNLSVSDALYVWNEDGTGGNKQGKLLASHFFDDDQCYQDRGDTTAYPIYTERKEKFNVTGELPCQGSFQLPSDLQTSGTYTVAWVWDWPENPNEVGNTTEIYTSCATINLSPSNTTKTASVIKVAAHMNVMSAAIESQIASSIEVLTRGTGTAAPPAVTDAGTTTSAATAAATTTPATSPSGGKKPTSGVKTVTVTAAPIRVTEYQTVTVDPAGQAVGTASGSAVTVPATAGASSSPKTSLLASSSSSSSSSSNGASGSASASSSGTGAATAAVTGSVVVTSVTPFVLAARATGHLRRMR